MNEDRLPPLPPDRWSDAQRRAADEVIRGPRGALISPFVPLLRSPELMGHAQRMGEYLRYRSAIGLKLSELAILITAHAWSQPVEWAIHAPIALREGISADTIAAIGQGQRPGALADDWGYFGQAILLYQRTIPLSGTPETRAKIFAAMGHIYGEVGDTAKALECYRESKRLRAASSSAQP